MANFGKENGRHGALGGQLWSKSTIPPLRCVCTSECVTLALINLHSCDFVCPLLCGFQQEARDFKAMKSSEAAGFMSV